MSTSSRVRLSVVIPVYKRQEMTREAVVSVLRQEEIGVTDDIEIIVVDDDDRDNRDFYSCIDTKIVYLRNLNAKGPGGSRQTGLDVARGDCITFLDSDDTLASRFAMSMLDTLSVYPSASACVCLGHVKFERGFDVTSRLKLYLLNCVKTLSLLLLYLFNKRRLPESAFYLCQVSHMIIRKDRLSGFRFDSLYRDGGEDWDMAARLLVSGDIIVNLRRLAIYRYSPGSVSDSSLNYRKWNSYALLVSHLPSASRVGVFHWLFLLYIKLFGGGAVGPTLRR